MDRGAVGDVNGDVERGGLARDLAADMAVADDAERRAGPFIAQRRRLAEPPRPVAAAELRVGLGDGEVAVQQRRRDVLRDRRRVAVAVAERAADRQAIEIDPIEARAHDLIEPRRLGHGHRRVQGGADDDVGGLEPDALARIGERQVEHARFDRHRAHGLETVGEDAGALAVKGDLHAVVTDAGKPSRAASETAPPVQRWNTRRGRAPSLPPGRSS